MDGPVVVPICNMAATAGRAVESALPQPRVTEVLPVEDGLQDVPSRGCCRPSVACSVRVGDGRSAICQGKTLCIGV